MPMNENGVPPESEVVRRLRSGDLTFEPFRVAALISRERGPVRPDYVLELEWGDRRRRFAVEYKRLSTPKQLEEAIQQAKRNAVGDLLPMVMVPYLRSSALARLVETETSGIDLSGNGFVTVPGEWFVYKTGERNKYPARAPIKAVYAGKSSLVGRVFLLCAQFESVTQVRDEIERRGVVLSLGTVSKVLRALEDDLVIQRKPTIRAIQPDLLIEKLADHFREPSTSRVVTGRVENRDTFLARAFENARRQSVSLVGRSLAVYTTVPESQVTLYTTSAESVLQDTMFEETPRFSNVSVIETADELVYFDARPSNGYRWISPVQLYLQLVNGGKREQEIATQLRVLIEATPADVR